MPGDPPIPLEKPHPFADNWPMNADAKNASKNAAPRRGRGASGFTIMEVGLALIVFAMMTLMFGAVFPMAIRGAQHGNNYSQAALLAQRKIDQLRSAGYNNLNATALQSASLHLIDSPQPSGYPINSGGATTYSFAAVDNLIGAGGFYAPPNTGSVGTVTIGDYHDDIADPNTSLPPSGNAAQVTVTITWGGRDPGAYSASALIINMSHR